MGRFILKLLGIGTLSLLLIPLSHLTNNAATKVTDFLFGDEIDIDDIDKQNIKIIYF